MSSKPHSYHYKAFGLTISSEFKFNELIPISDIIATNTCDVTIKEGRIVKTVPKENYNQKLCWYASDDYFFLEIKELAKFEVFAGNTIVIEREKNADIDTIYLFILGTCLGIICHQKGLLPIHGCAIATNSGCKIFAGPIGIGKSTLAAGFLGSGYPILADDISVISLSRHNPPLVYPGYPQIKLCPDSAKRLNINIEKLIPLDPEKTKFRYPIYKQHHHTPLAVSAIYFLNTHKDNYYSVQNLHGTAKFIHLKNNTYRASFIDAIKVNGSHFRLCAQLSDQIPMYSFKRPASQFHIPKLVQFLETHFLESDS